MARTGDTPLTDAEPHLVDALGDDVPPAQGDAVREDEAPALVDHAPAVRPTAGELRAGGYEVDPDVDEDAVPTRYVADSPTPAGEVRLVVDTSDPDDGLTPMERLAARPEASGGDEGGEDEPKRGRR